jgi:hypothetical protein
VLPPLTTCKSVAKLVFHGLNPPEFTESNPPLITERIVVVASAMDIGPYLTGASAKLLGRHIRGPETA